MTFLRSCICGTSAHSPTCQIAVCLQQLHAYTPHIIILQILRTMVYIVYFVCMTETLNILKSTCIEYIEGKILPIHSELSHYRHPKLNNNA